MIATFYRKMVMLPQVDYGLLLLEVIRDDGVVVYINGRELL